MQPNGAATPLPNDPVMRVSVQSDLGAGMVAIMETYLPQTDAMNGKLDGLLDRMHAAGTRQRAKAEIDAMEKHVEQHLKMIADGNDRVEKAEQQFRKDVATLQLKIETLQKDGAQHEKASRDDWARSNKRGDWKASGAVAQRLDGYRKQIEDHTKQIEKLGAERDKALAAENHARDVAQAEIETTRAKIKERQALISPAE